MWPVTGEVEGLDVEGEGHRIPIHQVARPERDPHENRHNEDRGGVDTPIPPQRVSYNWRGVGG